MQGPKTSYKCHKLIGKYLSNKPAKTFWTEQQFTRVYNFNSNKWQELDNLQETYCSSWTLNERIAYAQRYSDLAIELRDELGLTDTVLTEHRQRIFELNELLTHEIQTLVVLHKIMVMKEKGRSAGTKNNSEDKWNNFVKAGTKNNSEDKWNNFVNDVNIFNQTGYLPTKWDPVNISKMRSFCFFHNKTWPEVNCNLANVNQAAINEVITRLNNTAQYHNENGQQQGIRFANVFAVDHLITGIRHFKKHNISSTNAYNFLGKVALFTRSYLERNDFLRFVHAQSREIAGCMYSVTSKNPMYIDPGKLTIKRLFGLACIFFDTRTVHGVLQQSWDVNTIKLLCELTNLDAPVIQQGEGKSTDAEYLLYQISTLGVEGGFALNKNRFNKPSFKVGVKFVWRTNN